MKRGLNIINIIIFLFFSVKTWSYSNIYGIWSSSRSVLIIHSKGNYGNFSWAMPKRKYLGKFYIKEDNLILQTKYGSTNYKFQLSGDRLILVDKNGVKLKFKRIVVPYSRCETPILRGYEFIATDG